MAMVINDYDWKGMSEQLLGKTAIITGGSTGMGAATARRFVSEGANVVIADINMKSADLLAADLGKHAHAEKLDVRNPEAWQMLVEQCEKRFGSVDVLVNNAGIADPAPLEEWDLPRLQRMLDVNLIGVFNGIQAVAPAMKRAGGGAIVNIGSIGALQGIPRMSGYVVAKWGVRGLTKVAALELGSYGIRVNAVHPGQTRTPMTDRVDFDVSNIALGRVGEPEDIAQAVLFLASEEARFITGSELEVDGGQAAGPANYQGLPK